MAPKATGPLSVKSVYAQQENKLVIHPNDGFDLGLLQTTHRTKIFSNVSAKEFNEGSGDYSIGYIEQSNKCQLASVEISTKFLKKIGSPQKVKLVYHDDKVLILSIA